MLLKCARIGLGGIARRCENRYDILGPHLPEEYDMSGALAIRPQMEAANVLFFFVFLFGVVFVVVAVVVVVLVFVVDSVVVVVALVFEVFERVCLFARVSGLFV